MRGILEGRVGDKMEALERKGEGLEGPASQTLFLAFQLNQDNKLPTKIVNELKEIYGNV